MTYPPERPRDALGAFCDVLRASCEAVVRVIGRCGATTVGVFMALEEEKLPRCPKCHAAMTQREPQVWECMECRPKVYSVVDDVAGVLVIQQRSRGGMCYNCRSRWDDHRAFCWVGKLRAALEESA